MAHYGATLGPVRYDPAGQTFESLVTLYEGRDQVRIPVSLKLPIETEAGRVAPALIRQAKEKRRMERLPLRSRLRAGTTGGFEFAA